MSLVDAARDLYLERIDICLLQRIRPEELREELSLEIEHNLKENLGWLMQNGSYGLMYNYEVWSAFKENLDEFIGDMLGYKIRYYTNMAKIKFGMN